MKIAVLPQDDKSRSKPFYSLLVGLGYTQCISMVLNVSSRSPFFGAVLSTIVTISSLDSEYILPNEL